MTNKTRSLDDLAFTVNDNSWVWKDDMIVFPRDDGFYDADDLEYEATWNNDGSADRILETLGSELAREGMLSFTCNELDCDDHPICGEFPHDSIIAPRGIWND